MPSTVFCAYMLINQYVIILVNNLKWEEEKIKLIILKSKQYCTSWTSDLSWDPPTTCQGAEISTVEFL